MCWLHFARLMRKARAPGGSRGPRTNPGVSCIDLRGNEEPRLSSTASWMFCDFQMTISVVSTVWCFSRRIIKWWYVFSHSHLLYHQTLFRRVAGTFAWCPLLLQRSIWNRNQKQAHNNLKPRLTSRHCSDQFEVHSALTTHLRWNWGGRGHGQVSGVLFFKA